MFLSHEKSRVIILPQAPYLPESPTDILLAWVRQGRTLISVGMAGIWNPYGQDDLTLVTQVFGNSKITDQKPGRWQWKWQLFEANPRARVLGKDGQGDPSVVRAQYGKGTVLVCTSGYLSQERQDIFYKTLDNAIGQRPARCQNDLFELVVRVDVKDHRYLFVLNPHTREIREDEVVVAGNYPKSVDLGVGSGVALPARIKDQETRFTLRLHPGEGTVIALKP